MKILLQRVNHAQVTVDKKVVGQINKGILIFLGISKTDTEEPLDYLVNKIVNLRIFGGEAGEFDRSLLETSCEALVVSQFTLYGKCEKGRRPDFFEAAGGEQAKPLYEKFVEKLKEAGVVKVETGEFGAMMKVALENDGPATFTIEK